MLTGRDIIIISSIEWDSLWQGAQEIASRLGLAGHRVLYIENIGIRSPGWQDRGRVALRLKRWLGSLRVRGARQAATNVFVCSPLILPPFSSDWKRRINRQVLLQPISRMARRLGLRDAVIWVFLPTDTALDLINLLNTTSGTTVYYCVADFSLLTPHPARLQQCERDLLRQSDLVFATCRQLAEHCSQWNDRVFIFPNGVSLEDFPAEEKLSAEDGLSANGLNSRSLASTVSSPPRPVIGYVGGLHRFVDYHLLIAMAREQPQWSWVFVGPIQTDVGELSRLPNVRLLGEQPHRQLVNYIRHFDVGIVPYVASRETETVVPTKINEYLASGKPVVSTDLPPVREFNEQHHILFTTAPRPDAFLQAIKQALDSPTDPETIARRREVARQSDWQAQLNSMTSLIEAQTRAKGRGALGQALLRRIYD